MMTYGRAFPLRPAGMAHCTVWAGVAVDVADHTVHDYGIVMVLRRKVAPLKARRALFARARRHDGYVS